MSKGQITLVSIIVAAIVLTIGGLTWFYTTHVYVENYELAYKFDTLTGKMTMLDRTGWFTKKPFVEKINHIDLRPMQVCINANARVLNCKLVRFNKEGAPLFLSWHGRKDYNQSEATSGSSSSSSSTGSLDDILKSYAYDGTGTNYPFLTILREMKTDTAPTLLAPQVATTPEPVAAR